MKRKVGVVTMLGALAACSSGASTAADLDGSPLSVPTKGGDAARASSDPADGGDALKDATTRDGRAVADAGKDVGSKDAGSASPADSRGADAVADAAVSVGDDPALGDGLVSPSYHDYDVNHILLTGQSNCVSNAGAPPLSLAQPFNNYTFDTGLMHMGNCDGIGCTVYKTPAALVPLVEGDEFFDFPTETAGGGTGNQISFLAQQVFGFGTKPGLPASHNMLVTVNGRSGNTYLCLRKGGCDYQDPSYIRAFEQGIEDVQNGMALAKARGLTYVVRGVVVIHGESDHYDYTDGYSEFPMGGTDGVANEVKDYGDGLVEWQRDYESAIQQITGQTEPVYLFVSGLSGWTDVEASVIPPMQLRAHAAEAHGKVILVTPGYPMQIYEDCEHYNDYGERRLGEYFAKAYAQTVFGGKPWEPVRPRTITRSGAVVTVDYYVPVLPLVFDTTRVRAATNYGYLFNDNGTNATISKVELTGPSQVPITLAQPPSGTNMQLSYAENEPQPAGTGCIGPGTVYSQGASGNLRDSDTTPSYYSDANNVPYDMFDWGVIFTLPVQ